MKKKKVTAEDYIGKSENDTGMKFLSLKSLSGSPGGSGVNPKQNYIQFLNVKIYPGLIRQ